MRERYLVGLGSLMVTVHFVDEVFFSRQGGWFVVLEDLFLMGILFSLWFFWPRMNRSLKGWVSVLLGLFAAGGNIAYHWLPVLQGRPNSGFYTSLVSAPGALLIVIAGGLTLLHRTARSAGSVDTANR